MKQATTRRTFFRSLAALPLLAVQRRTSLAAGPADISRLIVDSRAHREVSQRMDFISRAMLGVKYQGGTLIGGPKQPEVFVTRDDAFDCVTFCEFVLAAAIAHDVATFETSLRRIRYEHGRVQWNQRNHLFADWCQRNVDSGICTRVDVPGTITVEKTMDAVGAPGRRHWSIPGIPPKLLLSERRLLRAGDIIGFVSHRTDLDYFHTGLIAFGKDGAPMLRNASQTHRRVLDQSLAAFVAQFGVRYVTLLRPAENPPAA